MIEYTSLLHLIVLKGIRDEIVDRWGARHYMAVHKSKTPPPAPTPDYTLRVAHRYWRWVTRKEDVVKKVSFGGEVVREL